MAQDTPKQAEAERGGDAKRRPGRPKGSRNRVAANDAVVEESADPEHTASGAAGNPPQGALDDLRESVEFGFEELHKQIDQLQEIIRGLGVVFGKKAGGAAASAEVLAELKRLSATEQQKSEHVDQWTRVMVELSGAERRRYRRMMRVVYRFARQDRARDAERKRARKRITWWQLCLLAVLFALVLYGGMQFIV
jgi:hypothetical protein